MRASVLDGGLRGECHGALMTASGNKVIHVALLTMEPYLDGARLAICMAASPQ